MSASAFRYYRVHVGYPSYFAIIVEHDSVEGIQNRRVRDVTAIVIIKHIFEIYYICIYIYI